MASNAPETQGARKHRNGLPLQLLSQVHFGMAVDAESIRRALLERIASLAQAVDPTVQSV